MKRYWICLLLMLIPAFVWGQELNDPLNEIQQKREEQERAIQNLNVSLPNSQSNTSSNHSSGRSSTVGRTEFKTKLVKRPRSTSSDWEERRRIEEEKHRLENERKMQEEIRAQNAENNVYIRNQPFDNQLARNAHENATINTERLINNMGSRMPERVSQVIGEQQEGYVSEKKSGKDMLSLLKNKTGKQRVANYLLYRGTYLEGTFDNLEDAKAARDDIMESARLKKEQFEEYKEYDLGKQAYKSRMEWLEENLRIETEWIEVDRSIEEYNPVSRNKLASNPENNKTAVEDSFRLLVNKDDNNRIRLDKVKKKEVIKPNPDSMKRRKVPFVKSKKTELQDEDIMKWERFLNS